MPPLVPRDILGVPHTRHIPIGVPAPILQGGGAWGLGGEVALPLPLPLGLALALGLLCWAWGGGFFLAILKAGFFLGGLGGGSGALGGAVLPTLLVLLLLLLLSVSRARS